MGVSNLTVVPQNTDRKTGHGAHRAYHVLPYTVDRTNLFVGKVEKHVFEEWDSPDASLLSLAYGTQTVAADCGISTMAGGGNGRPLCVGVERRYDEANSMAIYTYTFEGIASRNDQKYKEFEIEFTLEQAPIETHPDFQSLNDTYGPYDSLNRTWPAIVTAASASKGLQKPSTKGGPVTNPMYGVTSYLVPGCIYRVTYTNDDIEADLLEGVGQIDTDPDDLGEVYGNFVAVNSVVNQTAKDRRWLKMAPRVRQHGGCVTVSQEWMLGGPRGWLKQVYDTKSE
jgi:hypothetical protein